MSTSGPLSKPDAQRRVDAIAVFRDELERLRQEGVLELGDAQQAAVQAHHSELLASLAAQFDLDGDSRASQLSLAMRIASLIGALAAASAVFFLFRQFWGLLPTALQVLGLMFASVASLALTALLHARDRSGYFTKLAALVAFACFVLNISLLGAIFSITPSENALLAWAALALLLAYTCELRLLLVAALACIAGWIAARVGSWSGMYWLNVGQRPEHFFPAAVLAFALPQFVSQQRWAGFAASYRVFGLLCLLLPVLVLANWGHGSYLDLSNRTIEAGDQLLGFGISAAACWLGVRRGWGEVVNTGQVFFVIFLYTKVFDWWWDWLPKWVFFLLIALSAVLLMLVFQRLRLMLQAKAGAA